MGGQEIARIAEIEAISRCEPAAEIPSVARDLKKSANVLLSLLFR